MTFFRDDSTIKLAVVDPSLPEVIKKKEELAKKHHRTVTIFLISKHSFERALELYKAVVKIRNVEYGVKISEEDIKKFKAEIDNFEKLDTKLKEETNLTYLLPCYWLLLKMPTPPIFILKLRKKKSLFDLD